MRARWRIFSGEFRRGLTLVELVLAAGLLSIVSLALLALLDTSTGLLSRTEARRDLVEMASAVGELMARDLDTLENGPRGDLVCDWIMLDGDGDGSNGAAYPRLRLVRRGSPAELARLQAGVEAQDRVRDEGLIEVVWALIPRQVESPERRTDRVLWRGERILGDPDRLSVFDDRFFNANGKAVAGALDVVTGGVLWWGIGFATQTSVVHDGWTYGEQLRDATRSWDAWDRDRPDVQEHYFNEAGAGMPGVDPEDGLPLLPRRVRVELVFERDQDLRRRTTLQGEVHPEDAVLRVRDTDRIPEPGEMILIGEEWMSVRSKGRKTVSVGRGERGTRALAHPPDAVVHHGTTLVREVPVALYREDWKL